jgi:hypothetical protein
MAIINSYPSITVTPSDLLLVSDVSEEGNPTKTTSVQGILDLAASGVGFVTSIVAGNGLAVDQSTGIVTISANLSVSSSIPGLTFTNSPQGTLNIGISGTPLATQFLNGTGNWSTPSGGGGGGMTSWNLSNGSSSDVVSDGETAVIIGGSKIISSLSGTRTIQIAHSATTTTPTTSASSPAAGGTFDAIDSITHDATGHITGFNTNTVTLPATGQVYQAGPGINFDATTTPDTIEVDYTGTNNVVNSAIAATSSEDPVIADDFIYGRAADNNAYKNTLKSLLQLIIRNTAIPEIFFSARSGAFINAGNTADASGLSPFGAISITSSTIGDYDISFATTQPDTDYMVNITSENDPNFLTYRIKSKGVSGYTIEIFDSSTSNPINGKINVTMYSN